MEQLFLIELVNILNLLYGSIFFVFFINKLFNKLYVYVYMYTYIYIWYSSLKDSLK